MDTASMLNTMSFYCQPILPLVYDESMSYYETLCKVVGQLNNTGETVNKLNERLTAEIADREAGDAALDERLKQIEALNARIHFLVFDGANPSGAMPTRSELYSWVRNGDAIYTLFSTNEAGRGQVYAASCSYNAGNWGSEASNDFNIIVPLETKYDSANDYAVKQKVAKLTIPPISQTSLSVPWGLQIIEINTPYTSAEGVVNVIAVVSDSGSVNCNITPSEFLQLYNMTRGGKNLCVAVNAKLAYDGIARSSSIATVDTTNRIVRIAFERDYGTFTTNGVNQLNKTLDYIIGDAKTGTWVHETIDSKIFDFIRYEGFQFTRGAHDVITTDDESTPNAVYAQYHSDTSGKLYQNLPTRLIDSVDGAEYWNGTFDIYGGNHMAFTFVTSNYATASDKMLVRVIELSADVGATAWKYGVKEFTLPISGAVTYVDFWPTGSSEEYSKDLKAWTISLGTNQTFDAIFDLISSGADVVARLYKDSTKAELVAKSIEAQLSGDKTLGNINFAFVHATNDVFLGFPTIADAIWVMKTANSTSTYALYKWCALPAPAGDSTDNGKVPAVNGTKWELKDPTSKPLYITIDVTNIDERIYTLTDGNKTYTVEEIYEAKENGTPVFISPADIGAYFQVLDFSFSNTVFKAFFLNVVRRTDMSYGRFILSTIGGQTKGTYNVEGFLATASSANNGKFLKMKQDGSGIEYVDDDKIAGFKYFTYDARAASADMTPAEVRAFIAANPNTPVYMKLTNLGTNLPPAWGALQGARSSDGVLTFVATEFGNNSGNQQYVLVTSVSDTAWSTVSSRYLLGESLPSLSAPSFYTHGGDPVFGITEDSIIAKANGPHMRAVVDSVEVNGESYLELDLKRLYFETGEDASIDDLYKAVGRGSILCDIDFALGRVILDGSVEGTITGYNTDVYNQIRREITYERCSIWLKFNGENIRAASWKQTGSGAYTLTFFGAGAAAQPVKYVVTASASAASLAITGS